MGRTFAKVVLCSTNDFPQHKNDKIKRWVENNGGTFTTEMTPKVTHLIASTKAWKRYHPLGLSHLVLYQCQLTHPVVKVARHMKTVEVVKFEWLEESLLTKSRRPLKTEDYMWRKRSLEKVPKVEAKPDGEGQGDNTYEIRLSPDVRKDAAPVSKDKKIEKTGWDEYDICIMKLILDRCFLRQGVSKVRGKNEGR